MPNEYEKALSVISKPADKRHDHEIHQLVPWLRSKAKLFKGLKTDILADIIRNCQYQTKVRDELVIKQGDIGDCFYITLNGKVTIYILNKDQLGDLTEPDDDDGDPGNIIHYDEEGNLDRSRLGNFVTSLEGGAPFGDVALTSGDSIRTASIVADERTDLLVVDRALYNRSMKEVLAKEFHEKTSFIKTDPLFANWPAKYRKQLAMALYKETFGYESTLTRQGDRTSDMYFILSGQVEIQMDPNHHPQQYPKIFQAAKENVVDKLVRKVEQPPRHRERENRQKNGGNPNTTSFKRRENVKCTRLCHLGVNESVGDIELTMALPTYVQTAVCRETTEVLVLEAKHYDRLFVRRHPRTIETMRDRIGFKLDYRLSMLRHKGDIPFLGYLQTIIASRHKPAPLMDSKDQPTVSMAEREFLNHKGPLIDLHGPGSVFYLIKLREQVRMRLRAKRGERMERQFRPTRSLPNSVLMAAAKQISSLPEDGPTHLRPVSARAPPYPDPPMTIRNIQSARQRTEVERLPETNEEEVEERLDGAREEREPVEDEYVEEIDPMQSYTYRSLQSPEVEGPEEHDARLSFLEEKVRRWLKEDNPKGKPQVAHMRRLPIQDMEFQPRPGNKIYVRKRERTLNSQISNSHPHPHHHQHQHQHHHHPHLHSNNNSYNYTNSNGNHSKTSSHGNKGSHSNRKPSSVTLTSTGLTAKNSQYNKVLLSQ